MINCQPESYIIKVFYLYIVILRNIILDRLYKKDSFIAFAKNYILFMIAIEIDQAGA